jgi:hypothetical protein
MGHDPSYRTRADDVSERDSRQPLSAHVNCATGIFPHKIRIIPLPLSDCQPLPFLVEYL